MSNENKPKVVEVVLKFAKLYDGVDFNDNRFMDSMFDDYIIYDYFEFENSVMDG